MADDKDTNFLLPATTFSGTYVPPPRKDKPKPKMAAVMHPQSPPAASPTPNDIPPLSASARSNTNTSTFSQSQSSQRPVSVSYASHRLSRFSTTSAAARSRPGSTIWPMYPSSLPYALVRDFAYPALHPLHYGPQPEEESVPGDEEIGSPVSDGGKRVSDPQPTWWDRVSDDSHREDRERLRLEPRSYSKLDGPPYREDPDLHSPIITSAKGKRREDERGRDSWGRIQHHVPGRTDYHQDADAEAGGPGGEYITYPPRQGQLHAGEDDAMRRDSHFAGSGTLPQRAYHNSQTYDENQGYDGANDDDDPSRYSRAFEFSISHPDESFHGRAIALFDFVSENSNELGLVEGQVILVSYRHGQGWLVAQDPKTGESGLVPEEYVRLEREIDMEGWERADDELDETTSDHGDDEDTQEISHTHTESAKPANEAPPANQATHLKDSMQRANSNRSAAGAASTHRRSDSLKKVPDDDDIKTPTTKHGSGHSGQWYGAVQSRFETSRSDLEVKPKEQVRAERERRGSDAPPTVGRKESPVEKDGGR